jgi:hypothetical protein
VDGSELLQTSHLSEAEHSAFSSSKRQVGILSPIIYPAARLLPIRVANNFHCRFAVSALGNITFKHLTFVINGSPEVMCLSTYLYEDLIQLPLPVLI